MDEAACNYVVDATLEDDSCEYPAEYYDCAGECLNDADSDGVCDELEIEGCMQLEACNFDDQATDGNESLCDYCSCLPGELSYPLVIESTEAVGEGITYRFYVQMQQSTDRLSAVFGTDEFTLAVSTPEGAFNSPYNGSWSASGINPAFLPIFPDLVDDTYATIGLTGPATSSGLANAADPSIVEDLEQPITPFFNTPGATNLLSNTLTGASWYLLNTASNGLPDEQGRVLIMQVTTTGVITGRINYQVFPLGSGADSELISAPFHGAGVYGNETTCGCLVESACNYDPDAMVNDGSCLFVDAIGECGGDCLEDADADGVCDDIDFCIGAYDECGICNGNGIPTGDCDCDGNQLDALGVCGGSCLEDADADGVCDDVDECVGSIDSCGICNGLGAVYSCGCYEQPEEDCDCDGNQLDALGVCGGDCGADVDGDGVCDDVDDCIGAFDACGVCNGPGDIYECGCTDIPEGDCDCDGNVLDAIGVCGGLCEVDLDGDGICDDVDACVASEYCGWGTVWNADSAACVLAVPPFLGEFGDYNTLNPCYYDLDLSGSVGAGDLINFLSTYNLVTGCSWTDE
jgi:hypothetical protein